MNRAAIETMRVIDRRIPLWRWHRERLCRSGWVGIPEHDDVVAALPMGRLRVRVDVEAKGWSVSWEELGEPWHGLVLAIAGEPYVNPSPAVKWKDRVAYDRAFEGRPKGADDVLLFTPDGLVTETSRMSLFWLREGTLHTPGDPCAPLQGVARSLVLDWSPWPVQTGRYPTGEVLAADLVFVSNAVRGIVWVRCLGDRRWEAPSDDFMAFRTDFERRAYG